MNELLLDTVTTFRYRTCLLDSCDLFIVNVVSGVVTRVLAGGIVGLYSKSFTKSNKGARV